jgi:ankyrin repeat protein
MGKASKNNGGKKVLDPIFAAIESGDASSLSALLAADSEAHTKRNADGWSPLIAASYAGDISCIDILLNAGADVRATCKDADSCIHYASAQGHLDAITRLAAAGCPLNKADNDGETPLDVAQNGKVKKLLEKLITEADNADEGGAAGGAGGGRCEEDDEDEDEGGPPQARGFAPGRYQKK